MRDLAKWSSTAPLAPAGGFDSHDHQHIVKARPALAAEYFEVVAAGPTMMALRYLDGVLVELIAPGARVLYRKGYAEQGFERLGLAERFEVAPRLNLSAS